MQQILGTKTHIIDKNKCRYLPNAFKLKVDLQPKSDFLILFIVSFSNIFPSNFVF